MGRPFVEIVCERAKKAFSNARASRVFCSSPQSITGNPKDCICAGGTTRLRTHTQSPMKIGACSIPAVPRDEEEHVCAHRY